VFTAPQHFENKPIALFAVLAGQRLDVLERRRLERLEAVSAIDARNDIDHVFAAANVFGQGVAHAARRAGSLRHRIQRS
jgi:hypothetical protein